LDQVSLGTWGQPGVSAEGKTWGFAPHTAHNSLVLDLTFAEYLEAELHAPSVSRRAAALQKLRERVREQVRPDCPGWEVQKSVSRTDAKGKVVKTKVWSRERPRGHFTNYKTEAAIGVSPKEFMQVHTLYLLKLSRCYYYCCCYYYFIEERRILIFSSVQANQSETRSVFSFLTSSPPCVIMF
jgi:hypothetical protein